MGPSERKGTEGVLGLQRSASSSLLEKASTQVGSRSVVGRGEVGGVSSASGQSTSFVFLLPPQAREPRLARITPTPAQKVPEPFTL